MSYDLIIACGDSFTEGHRAVLNITEDQTWPGLVSKDLGIPYINLARGGASNFEIAMQPLQCISPEHKQLIANAENPLILFNFTIFDRLAYISPETGILSSVYSIVPEDMSADKEIKQLRNFATILNLRAMPNFDDDELYWSTKKAGNHATVKAMGVQLDFYQFATTQAIRTAFNYKAYFKNATVKWGFIHFNAWQSIDGTISTLRPTNIARTLNHKLKDEMKIYYPYYEHCYNSSYDHKPLQDMVFDHRLEGDNHPNRDGIRLLADFFTGYIKGMSNEKDNTV